MPYPYNVTFYPDGTTLSDVNYASHRQEISNAMIPANIDDYSADVAQMKLTTNPGDVGSESLASDLAGEITRLRYTIKNIKDFLNGSAVPQWYSPMTSPIPIASGGTGASTASSARVNLNSVGRDGDSRGSPLNIGTTDSFDVNFISNNASRLSILASGVISLLSGQLKFPLTQNPSSDANVLDDYEEGTWTPSLTRSGTPPNITYLSQDGIYVKIGRIVLAVYKFQIQTVSSQGTGFVQIIGLPFVSYSGVFYPGFGLNVSGSVTTESGPHLLRVVNNSDKSDIFVGNYSQVNGSINATTCYGAIIYYSNE